MAFPTRSSNPLHNGLIIQVPDDLHYNYASSVESNSPYTPDFPSPSHDPFLHDGPPSQRIMYHGESEQQLWTEREACYGNNPVIGSIELPRCTPPVLLPAGLPLHAPVPLPKTSPLLFSDAENYNQPPHKASSPQECPPLSDFTHPPSLSTYEPQRIFDATDYSTTYSNEPLQPTFPTPSELLVELASKNGTTEVPRSDRKVETARKARQRAVAQSVGFTPTDPDSISSHEKKRFYLECLEQYVMYLHKQLSLVGAEPIKLEKVPNYRGLSSRSIRPIPSLAQTLLVHMENNNRKLNLRTLSEEQRFIALREAVFKQNLTAPEEYRSH